MDKAQLQPIPVVSETGERPIYFIDNLNNCQIAVDFLSQTSTLAVDLEGNNLSRHGSISLLQVDDGRGTFLFDIKELGAEGFEEGGLKELLESRRMDKLIFDSRNDSDALWHLYSIALQGVVDIQILACMLERQQNGNDQQQEFLVGFGRALQLLNISVDERESAQQVKKAGKTLFYSTMGSDHSIWDLRPLPAMLLKYAANDVHYLFDMYHQWQALIPMLRLRRLSQQRVVDARCAEFSLEEKGLLHLKQQAEELRHDIFETEEREGAAHSGEKSNSASIAPPNAIDFSMDDRKSRKWRRSREINKNTIPKSEVAEYTSIVGKRAADAKIKQKCSKRNTWPPWDGVGAEGNLVLDLNTMRTGLSSMGLASGLGVPVNATLPGVSLGVANPSPPSLGVSGAPPQVQVAPYPDSLAPSASVSLLSPQSPANRQQSMRDLSLLPPSLVDSVQASLSSGGRLSMKEDGSLLPQPMYGTGAHQSPHSHNHPTRASHNGHTHGGHSLPHHKHMHAPLAPHGHLPHSHSHSHSMAPGPPSHNHTASGMMSTLGGGAVGQSLFHLNGSAFPNAGPQYSVTASGASRSPLYYPVYPLPPGQFPQGSGPQAPHIINL
eukprot:GCRY01000377.1.p1 GENE.GCRY01000377.1~~GCRY01000377.1.p1  ORF type:complete len:608 (+),score=133.82 GCRY01000377.1:385-2208(+)